MTEAYRDRVRVQFALGLLLSLTVLASSLHTAEGYDHDHRHFDVRLVSPTTSRHGVPGVTHISLTGIGFQKSRLDPKDVEISLAPAKTTGSRASTPPTSITSAGEHTRRFLFTIPASISVDKPTLYRVKISGRDDSGRPFDSDNSASLTVEPGTSAPTLYSVSPDSGQTGNRLTVTIRGSFTHFAPGTTQASFGAGISVGDAPVGTLGPVTVNGPTSATAQIDIDPSAAAGQRTVAVRTGGENASLSNGFAVLAIPPPVANPSGPYHGNVGQAINFDGSKSTAPNGQALTYAWNFGDNATGSGVTPTHAYSSGGTFTVSLTVTDTSGGTNTATTVAVINRNPQINSAPVNTGQVGTTYRYQALR